ncbi:hypothetical protein [Pseudoalteromonas sp. SW0106-04]|uniref:hypothetical protein n=1 Tax=Pseudoalteromonas sp. SW0106-04 TaxID=1702169 RepID=UPI000AC6FA28|nr:hypothetical protein [Pseudoalteromonas sp. SW0106-04]
MKARIFLILIVWGLVNVFTGHYMLGLNLAVALLVAVVLDKFFSLRQRDIYLKRGGKH